LKPLFFLYIFPFVHHAPSNPNLPPPLRSGLYGAVRVENRAEPVRWCYYCKKAHNLSEFASAAYGKPKKIACCPRG
jgi:hypothetical protein